MKRAVIVLLLISGCAGAGPDGSAGGGTGPNPDGPGGATPLVLSGQFEVSSHFDLTAAGLFPDLANDTLGALSGLKDDPARTIISLLQAANVPIVSTVLGFIPSVIRSYFEGWLNDHVFKALFNNVPVTEQLASLIEEIAQLVTRFEVVTTLNLPAPDAVGNARASHALEGVAFTLLSKRTVVRAPDVVSQIIRDDLESNAVLLTSDSPLVEDGRLFLGDHFLGVPIGDFFLKAVEVLVKAKFGANTLRDAVGMVFNCPALAKSLAARCVGPVCLGRESELKTFCDAGLTVVVDLVTSKLQSISLKTLRFKGGEARLWDAPAKGGATDGRLDRIERGEWSAGIDIGKGERALEASFDGHRVGDPVR